MISDLFAYAIEDVQDALELHKSGEYVRAAIKGEMAF